MVHFEVHHPEGKIWLLWEGWLRRWGEVEIRIHEVLVVGIYGCEAF
jgi:hypothetical protein